LKSKRWIHAARKSHNYFGDALDKDIVRRVLWKHFGIAAVEPSDALLCLDGTHIFPDLETTNYTPKTYFELQGPYHEQIEDSMDYTWRKRKKYEELRVDMIEIWADQPKSTPKYSISHIRQVLEANNIRRQ